MNDEGARRQFFCLVFLEWRKWEIVQVGQRAEVFVWLTGCPGRMWLKLVGGGGWAASVLCFEQLHAIYFEVV